MSKSVTQSFEELRNCLESPSLDDRYIGYDPFDGLNSKVFQKSPFNKMRFFRLAWLQFHKKSPINFRKLFKVEKGYNPQALALFILSYSKLYKKNGITSDLEVVRFLSEKLIDCQSKGFSGSCWGYNFDWQARAFFQPAFTPMIVPTAYAVEALFEAADLLDDNKLKDVALSSAGFVMKDLNRKENDHGIAFSYSPLDQTIVYNATLLASKLLTMVYSYTGNEQYKELAKSSINYCVQSQSEDGSWTYGEKDYHQWIDNFHTGYNLECIQTYTDLTGDNSYVGFIQKGLEYYLRNFFLSDGRSKYYSNRIFPIDIDNPSQLVITLSKLNKKNENEELLNKVLRWTIDNMQSRKGYFYFQINGLYKNRISYLRWSQAWIFYALSMYICDSHEKEDKHF